MARSNLTIFSLPRELRDEIWVLVVSHDMRLLSGLYTPVDIYKTPKESRQVLTVFNLLLVSKAVKIEITAIFRKRRIFTFHTSSFLRYLLEYGDSSWGRSARRPDFCPRILFAMGHVSIFSHGTVCADWRRDDATKYLICGGKWRKIYYSIAHPPGWNTIDPGARRLLQFIHQSPMKLRSLEMSAILLFKVRAVRELRRLRGVDLHFAFIPEGTKPQDQDQGQEASQQDEPQAIKWLAETADTNIILPIYETPSDIKPVSVAPLSCLAIAIRREAASSEAVTPRAVAFVQDQVDPPLWIEFDDGGKAVTESITTAYPSLSPPTSGWYKYSARDPGVACLEKAQRPLCYEPLKRKMLRRQRQEKGSRYAGTGPHFYQGIDRTKNLDLKRANTIYGMGLQDIVVMHI